ncbi:MAG TPA: methyltransferase domain-containing protein [Micropepsaceae bacterium]|jgi:phosphatidylethanolamine/phosphatidyl-N-methylethanolamine N-methyltransferase
MKTNPLKEELQFLRGLVANPLSVGAVAPSSVWLARAVAAQMDLNQAGPILELGPGTGAITEAILRRGVPPDRLTVIEYDPAFARQIAARFHGVNVILGDAFELGKLLAERGSQRFSAIVSGIPLLNFTPEKRRSLLEGSFEHLRPGGPFVQFSYGFQAPVSAPAGATARLAAFVWRNIPPARVWVYSRA